jgi:hypothetical protein
MKYLPLFIFMLITSHLHSQKMKIINPDKAVVEIEIINEATKNDLLNQFNGQRDKSLQKKWTARTYTLSNGKIILEFFDRQAALIEDVKTFKKLERVMFVRNMIGFLKRNISYKIELDGKWKLSESPTPLRWIGGWGH